jgi:DNA-binding LytR/AlgR family response regulator
MRVYKERPDVTAVVHAHPMYATAFAIAGIPLTQPIMPEAVIALGCVPIAEYGTPSTEEIPDAVSKYLQSFDAVLLDIYMSDMNGMEVAKHIRAMNNNMHILFLTSSAMFAVESYCVEATDYLLKPIKKERLFQSLDKLFSRMDASIQQGITVKDTDGHIIKVLWNQLMYLEAMGHYVVFHHANGTSTKTFLSFSSLLEQLLSHSDFIQSHRSYLVNLRYVHRIEKHALVMLDGAQLPLPKSRYQQLSDRFHDVIFGGDTL